MEIKCEVCGEVIVIFSSDDFEIKSEAVCTRCYYDARDAQI